ncbi:MAG: redoxin domain-containing protein [Bacteroidales bacterium]|nr:redoxin domain-containing protein [Bacteroidales bacterium]
MGGLYNPTNAQIHIKIKGAPNNTFYLQQIKGDRVNTLDSTIAQNEEVEFAWDYSYSSGMYQIFSGANSVVFLATERPVYLQTNWPSLKDSLQVLQSKENKLWATYLQIKNTTYQNLDLLNPVVNWYEKDSEFYHLALKEFENQQQVLSNWLIRQLKANNEYLLALQLIQADLKPTLPLGLNIQEQQEYFKQHWFDDINWNENDLINSNILSNKITEYLGLYADRNMDKAQLQMAFKSAVDQVIPLSQGNSETYAFVLDYLVRGFERYDFEEVILHIALNYPPPTEQCENEERKSEALARLEKYESMQVGQTAEDFMLPNQEGENIQLSASNKDKILLVFWASWCPHCKELIPQIEDWYTKEKQENWQVYTISIDTEKEDLQEFIKAGNIHIPILCNYRGWDTQAAIDYNIYATPTMIVLDKNLKIIDKPARLGDLVE